MAAAGEERDLASPRNIISVHIVHGYTKTLTLCYGGDQNVAEPYY